MEPDTRAVHAGHRRDAGRPLSPAIAQTAVHVFDSLETYDLVAAGEVPGHFYGRSGNESTDAFASAVAELEGAAAGLATGSGMAAVLVGMLALAPRPCPIVLPLDLYGTTLALVRQDLEPLGYVARVVPPGDAEAFGAALAGAGLAVCETVSNPLCRVVDLDRLAQIAAGAGVPLLVDNTFATPILCRPLDHGATAVVHSATKYLGGHSDLVAGALVGPAPVVAAARAKAIRFGTTLGPFEAWLALRGLRTLGLRVRRHCEVAVALARALTSMPGVSAVHHPLLEQSADRERAARLLPHGTGGMLAFELEGGRAAVQRLMDRLRLVCFAASLGGVETTISYPELTSHRGLARAELEQLGVRPGTVRVSCGIEHPEDVVADFHQALAG